MDTIVVGVDGSKGSQAAVRWVARQAQSDGGPVIAVHVVRRTGLWTLSAVQINIDTLLAELQTSLDGRWVAPLRSAGVSYSTKLVRGDPAIELLRVAGRAAPSMLVVGSRGHSNLTDLVVGGTVHKVINRSEIPIVVVPAGPPAAKVPSSRTKTAPPRSA